MTDPHATGPKSTSKSGYKKYAPQAFVETFYQKAHWQQCHDICLWGHGKETEGRHIIQHITFDDCDLMLFIQFEEGASLTVWNPGTVMESQNDLQLLTADRVKWRWKEKGSSENYYVDYKCIGNTLEVKTNEDSQEHVITLLPNLPAVSFRKM